MSAHDWHRYATAMRSTVGGREPVALLAIASAWFCFSLFVLRMASPPLPAMVAAILPAAALVSGILTHSGYAVRSGLPVAYPALAANAIWWAAVLLLLRRMFRRPSVGQLWLLVAIASFPLLALPEVLEGDTPLPRLFHPIGPVLPGYEWVWPGPVRSLRPYVVAVVVSSVTWATVAAAGVWLLGRLRRR